MSRTIALLPSSKSVAGSGMPGGRGSGRPGRPGCTGCQLPGNPPGPQHQFGGSVAGGQKCADSDGGDSSESGGAGKPDPVCPGGARTGEMPCSKTNSGGSTGVTSGDSGIAPCGRVEAACSGGGGAKVNRLPHRARIRLVPSLRMSSPFGTRMVWLVQCTEFAERYDAY